MFGDVRKIAFRRLCYFGCVLACCVAYFMLYLFGDIPNTYTYVFRVLTSGFDFTQDPQGALEGGPRLGAQHCQTMAIDCPKRRPVDKTTVRQWVEQMEPCRIQVQYLHMQPTNPIDGAWSHPRTVNARASMVLKLVGFLLRLVGFLEIHPKSNKIGGRLFWIFKGILRVYKS